MLQLDDNGFLGEGVDDWSRAFKSNHRPLLDQCEQLNRDAHSLLYAITIHTKDLREIIVTGLFMRALEFYQAMILLLEKGMQPSGKGVCRCLLDAVFRLVAVAKDDETLQAYIASDERERLKTTNKAQHNNTPNMQLLQEENLGEIKDEIKQTIDENKIKRDKTESYARKACMHDWYVDLYPYLSKAVHSHVRDLERQFRLDDAGQVEKLQYGPTDSDSCVPLIHGSHCLILGVCAAVNVFKHSLENKDNLKETFRGHESFFKEKMDELNTQNPLDRTDATGDSSQRLAETSRGERSPGPRPLYK